MTRRAGSSRRRLLRASGAAATGRVVFGVLVGRASSAPGWSAPNYRGQPVSMLAGPVAVLAGAAWGAAAGSVPRRLRLAAVTAGCGAAVVGRYDDRYGAPSARGLVGHLDAFRSGRDRTGVIKIVGIGASGLAAGALARPALVDVLLAGGVVAGTANLVNLLDVRPGRALKGVLLIGVPFLGPGPAGDLLAGPLGAAAAMLPVDLAERSMLGDAGANGLGALLGVALTEGRSRRHLTVALLALGGLTAASEAVSFSAVIDRVPPLRRLDRLGRRPPSR